MLARIADSLFWMSRYVERADGIMRSLKINYNASLDVIPNNSEFNWAPLLKLCTTLTDTEISDVQYNTKDVIPYIIHHPQNANSLVSIITYARNNARAMQDHITTEVWRCLNGFYHFIQSDHVTKKINDMEILVLIDELLQYGLLYYGIIEITMPRNEGWDYLNLGKHVERALQTIDLLDTKYSEVGYDIHTQTEIIYWKYLLLSASGYEYYLKTYRKGLNGIDVANLIILRKSFPRSITFCLHKILYYFRKIKNEQNLKKNREIEFELEKLINTIRYTEIELLNQLLFKDLLFKTRQQITKIYQDINSYYFNYS